MDYKNKKRNVEELKKEGLLVEGEFLKVYIRRIHDSDAPDTFHYYVICKWKNPRDEKYYIFSSYTLTKNPANLIEERGITKFPIYIDKNNVTRYYMDLDILKESAGGITYEK